MEELPKPCCVSCFYPKVIFRLKLKKWRGLSRARGPSVEAAVLLDYQRLIVFGEGRASRRQIALDGQVARPSTQFKKNTALGTDNLL